MTSAKAQQHRAKWFIPKPRRFSVVLMAVMFLGVDITSFHVCPVIVQVIVVLLWEMLVLCGSISRASGVLILTIMASFIKAMTVALIIWIIRYPHSTFGPTVWWYWIPLGALNMGSGLWFLQVIRKKAV